MEENNCSQLINLQKQASSKRRPLFPKNPNNNIINHEKDEEKLKLDELALSFNIQLRSADMPSAMQQRAIRHTRALLDSVVSANHRRPNPTLLARSLKKEFDSVYGPAWHCVVGKSFGSFVTHSAGGFLYFSVDSFFFLLFKTEVHVIAPIISNKS